MSQVTRIAIATLLMVGALPLVAGAQVVQWTTIGSAGTLYDPKDPTKVTMWSGVVSHAHPNTGFVRLTYNLPVPGHLLAYANTAMAVRFRDAGNSGDWIIVRLQEFDPSTGLTYTKMTFNSNSYTPSGSSQEGWSLSPFDFNPYKVYYLDAEIYRSSLEPPTPLLYSIRLWRY